jgi:hypothetical protein
MGEERLAPVVRDPGRAHGLGRFVIGIGGARSGFRLRDLQN